MALTIAIAFLAPHQGQNSLSDALPKAFDEDAAEESKRHGPLDLNIFRIHILHSNTY